MKKRFNHCHIPIYLKENSFFKRILFFFILACSTTFFLFTILITVIINNNYKKELIKINEKSLAQTVNITEDILKNVFTTSFSKYNYNASLAQLLYSDEFAQSDNLNAYYMLPDILSSNNVIHSVYIINHRTNSVIYADSSVRYRTEINKFSDKGILKIIAASPSDYSPLMFYPREVSSNMDKSMAVKNNKFLSLIFYRYPEGAFVVNLDTARLDRLVNIASKDISSETFIFNKYGFVVSDSGNEDSTLFADDYSNHDLYKLIRSQKASSGVVTYRESNVNYQLLYSKESSFGFIYVTRVRQLLLDTNNSLLLKALLYSLMFFISTLIMSFIYSLFIYRPVQLLTNTIKKHSNSPDDIETDELAHISKAYLKMAEENHNLSKYKKVYENTAKPAALQTLLNGDFSQTYNTASDFSRLGIQLTGPSYLVITIIPDNINGCYESQTGLDLLLFSIGNIGSEIFSQYSTLEWVESQKKEIIFIININQTAHYKDEILQCIKKFQRIFSNYFNQSFSCGLGNIAVDLEDISEAYKQSTEALLYHFLYGDSSIIFYDSLHLRPITEQVYPFDLESRIIAKIKTGTNQGFTQLVQDFFDVIREYDYNQMILYILQIYAAIRRTVHTLNLSMNDTFHMEIDSMQLGTISDCQNKMLLYCQHIIEMFREQKGAHSEKNKIVSEARAIVKENIYDPALSVEYIANKIHISVNYLRTIFKDIAGVSLSNYITEKKLELIYSLLTNTELNVQEISEQLGFRSNSYFFTFFKNHTGMSPIQYRKNSRKK